MYAERFFGALGLAAAGLGLGLGVGVAGRALAAPRIPDAPAMTVDTPVSLRLALFVNRQATGQVIDVRQRGRRLRIRAADLRRADVPVAAGATGWLDGAALAPITLEYDRARQQINIQVPADRLPDQYIGPDRDAPAPARASPGGLLNYDLYANRSARGDTAASLSNTLRLFGPWGTFDSAGQLQYGRRGFGRGGALDYIRFDTTWQYFDTTRLDQYAAGDVITGAQTWSRAARLGGLRWSRNFAIRPDLVTYPLPQFAGSAAVPSTVDLFIDDSRRRSVPVAPGPFTLSDVPYINGAGQAVIVTRNAQGQRVRQTIPFYVASDLLKPGLTDFSISAGALRQHFATRSFDYGAPAASGVIRHGLTRHLTLEGHGEGGPGLALGGVGAVFTIGRLGVVDIAGAASRYHGATGRQLTFGYQYTAQRFNIAAQHTRRRSGYADIGALADNGISLARDSTQITAGFDGGALGVFNAAFFANRIRTSRERLVNLSWNRNLPGNSTVLVSANHRLDGDGWSLLGQLVVPLGQRLTGRAGVDRSTDGRLRETATLDRSLGLDHGLGYRLAYAHADDSTEPHTIDTALRWRAERFSGQAGLYGRPDDPAYYADVRGSVVGMRHRFMLSDHIEQSFILVDTDGQAGLPVTYENSRIATTDADGYALIPYVTPWYAGHVGIDTLDLPADIRAARQNDEIAVRRGAGARVFFAMDQVASATVALVDDDGQALPVGSRVERVDGSASRLVGYDGEVYLPDLHRAEHWRVRRPDGRTCRVDFSRPGGPNAAARLGPFPCRPVSGHHAP